MADGDSLHEALSQASPGDTIVMKNGDWRDTEVIFDGTKTSNGKGGTKDAPITLKAEQSGRVLMTGESRLRIAGEHMVVDGLVFTDGTSDGEQIIQFRVDSDNMATNCRLTNSAMINFNPESPTTEYKWVGVYGTDNRIDNCWFSGMNHKGVTLTVWLEDDPIPNNTIIENCYFGDRAPGSGNGYETLRIGTSTRSEQRTDCIVRDNLFENCDGEIEVISNKSVGNQYIGNTFMECNGMLTLRHGSDCRVENNYFFGGGKDGSGGVRLIGPRHVVSNNYFQDLAGEVFQGGIVFMNGVPNSPLNRYLRVEDCIVSGNTMVNCTESFVFGVESSVGDNILAPINNEITNNIIVTDGAPVANVINLPIDGTVEGNIYFGGPLGAEIPGFNEVNPKLQSEADGVMRPTAPGVSEHSSASAKRRPLTKGDVGPDWMRAQFK